MGCFLRIVRKVDDFYLSMESPLTDPTDVDNAPQSISALPHHLKNGDTRSPDGPQHPSKTSVRPKERDKLVASIKSSSEGRQPLQLSAKAETHGASLEESPPPGSIKVSSRGHRGPEGTVSISRPASPYTLNPPIDFDGLSWPSAFPNTSVRQCRSEASYRLGDSNAIRGNAGGSIGAASEAGRRGEDHIRVHRRGP